MQNAKKFLIVIGILLTLTVFVTQVSAASKFANQSNSQDTRIANAQEAYEKDKLTQREMEILEAREELKGMGQTRGGERGRVRDSLNEQGLNVTCEEMQEMRETMQELELRGNGHRRGHN